MAHCPEKPCKLPAGHLGYHNPEAAVKKAAEEAPSEKKPTNPAPAGKSKE